ncbi:hypothetical protein ABZ508_24610 [Streptomyces lavendulocolor]|uniref:Lipoprotein n=1 Tax=Streptomyces lavendulocolor TaxID=67316 RepID=A0ABV2WB33_9ACTN
MIMHRRRFSSALVAAATVTGFTLGTACDMDKSSTPAPTGEKAQETRQPETPPQQKAGSERADLVRFQLDDRSQAGISNVWVEWTIKNNSSEKSNYTWSWEAVRADGTRVANSTEFVTDVQPGQTATGESPTLLKSTDGVKLNITNFDRTAGY